MSFLQTEVPSPRQALAALRERSARSARPARPARTSRLPSRGGGVVGLDLEPGFATAVETMPNSLIVKRAAVLELPADTVREGEVQDPEALGRALKEFFAAQGLSQRVRIGLANQRIVMRTVDLPPISDERQLASAIRFQAQEHIAMPLDQAVLEHQSLGLVGTADGPRSRVVLVAARREMVDKLLQACQIAGLRLEGVDLSAFALIRALRRPEDGDEQVAYINLGSMTNLAVAAGTQCIFTRVIPYGSESMVGDLAARRGLTTEHARGWLRHVGLSTPIAEIEGQPELVQATRDVLEDGAAQMASELRSTLSFYAGQAGGAQTERVVITGVGAALEGAVERVAAELGMPVEMRMVDLQPGLEPGVDVARLSVAAGLTLAEALA